MGRAGINSCSRQRPACWELHHASLLVRCHAPQYRHLYVLSCAGAESPSVILCAAVAFASRSLEYMRFPDTAHVFGWTRLVSSISQEELVLRYFAVIAKPHWALCEPNYATVVVVLSVTVEDSFSVTQTALISRPFLFMSNLCFRSNPLTNSRVALAIAPGRLDASTFTVDPSGPLRSWYRNSTWNVFMLPPCWS